MKKLSLNGTCMSRWACVVGFFFGFFLFGSPLAMAHRVNVFAWIDGNTVHVEGKFPGGRKVKNGQVIVLDADGRKLLDGRTDNQGMFSFKVPERKDLKIVLNAGMGHRGEWTIKAEEFLGQEAAEPPTTTSTAPQKGSTVNQGLWQDRKQPEISAGLDTREIQKLVEQSLDEKLAPILRMLEADRDRGPSVTEVMGGIGYIFGLIGVAAYVSSRRRRS